MLRHQRPARAGQNRATGMARKEKESLQLKTVTPEAVSPTARVVPGWMRIFIGCVFGVAALFAIWAVSLMADRENEISRFLAQGWDKVQILNTNLTFDTRLAVDGLGVFSDVVRPLTQAEVIVANKIRSLWHAAFMALCAGGFLWLFVLARPKRNWVYEYAKWGIVVLVAWDAWMLSRFYVKTMPLSALDENAVISMLKQDMPVHRVALVTQDGFYNWWLTFVFPYHGIQSVNITQMPRMPIDYKNFLESVGRNPIRFWQLAAVGYVLAPVQVWDQLQRDPALRDLFELRLAYNVEPGPEGAGVIVHPAMSAQAGQHVVLRFKQPGPRYALFAGAETCDDKEVLRRLADPAAPPFQKVYIAPECATNVPPLTGQGMVGQVESLGYRPGRFHLKTTSPQPALLRIAEKFDGDWKAWIDGQRVPYLRVDYIFQGVVVPAGAHEVLLKYAPAVWPLYIQLSGLAVFLGAALWLLVQAIRRKFRPSSVSTAPA